MTIAPTDPPLPLVVLGGSDGRPSRLPTEARDRHPLTGYKGMDVRIGGRPLVSHLAERLAGTGRFDPLYVAGPVAVFRTAGQELPVIDTDGTLAENAARALAAVRADHPDKAVAFVAADIFPEPAELRSILDDYWADPECALWYPTIRLPGERLELGAFGWKPGYPIRPAPGAGPVTVLPGHIVIVQPERLRLRFLLRLSQAIYQVRNRSIANKRRAMVARILPLLLAQDVRNLLRLRPPTFTWTMLHHGLTIAHGLRHGTLDVPRLERAGQKMVVRREAQRERAGRVRMPILEGMSLAKDIDTAEEAEEAARRYREGGKE